MTAAEFAKLKVGDEIRKDKLTWIVTKRRIASFRLRRPRKPAASLLNPFPERAKASRTRFDCLTVTLYWFRAGNA